MGQAFLRIARAVLIAAAAVSAVTLLSLLSQVNAVTAGFLYFVSILAVAVREGFLTGALGSVLATACFNYFFFPPIGTFQIADPQNWVSLACFLAATTMASRLVSRERERAEEARARQREIEALYELCVDLFTAGTAPGGLDAATNRALATIGAQGGGLVLFADAAAAGSGRVWYGHPKALAMHELLGSAVSELPAKADRRWRNIRVPVEVGGRPVGELVAYGTRANRETLVSVARLIGLALERERLLAEQARLDALKQSDSLKTALIQAVSHDLSTPLTSVLVSVESLKRFERRHPEALAAVQIIGEETTRLHRRIQNLLDLARLEAGAARPHREPTPAADLFRTTREHLPYVLTVRAIVARVEPGCPDLDVDPSLAVEILVNLVENAHRASPVTVPIELAARRHPADPARVIVEVLDRGSGFAPVAGDVPRKGLGLEIARSFTAALDGVLSLSPRDGGGLCARIDLPACRLSGAPALAGS
jgi:two-component system, OmpR family, sensor histidine kinase KdpD